MIQTFIDRFIDRKYKLREIFSNNTLENYFELVKIVIDLISDDNRGICHNSITEISSGGRSGSLLYIIKNKYEYDDPEFWYIKIRYGSCPGCDAFEQAIHINTNDQRIDDLISLSLHIVESIKILE